MEHSTLQSGGEIAPLSGKEDAVLIDKYGIVLIHYSEQYNVNDMS